MLELMPENCACLTLAFEANIVWEKGGEEKGGVGGGEAVKSIDFMYGVSLSFSHDSLKIQEPSLWKI